ncbi:hypothetical protein BBJ28_00014984 [Nothophytophthora sp. Chile5]|nr:hypothetical protein BBJ28_00014984 [Nothophytophthora sp. Chile5]
MDPSTVLISDDTSLDDVLAFIDSHDFGAESSESDDTIDGSVTASGAVDMEIEATTTALTDQARAALGQSGDRAAAVATADHDQQQQQQQPVQQRGTKWPSTPRRGGGRVRDRVIHLRSVAQKLERQLNSLKDHVRPAVTEAQVVVDENDGNTANCFPAAADPEGATSWRQLATTQYAARCQAEQENTRLRESMEHQIRVARRLERLLQRQLPDPVRPAHWLAVGIAP